VRIRATDQGVEDERIEESAAVVLRLNYPADTAQFKAGYYPVTFDFAEDTTHKITVQNLAKAT